MKKLVSIIVPVYNTEAYLRRCAESVLQQTYPEFEMIFIDDGSKDDSARICEELCREEPRFRFFPCPHRGVSAARNMGIEEARGEYLFFLDSDDTIHPHLLEALMELSQASESALATELYRHVDSAAPGGYMESSPGASDQGWNFYYMNHAEAMRQFSSRENGYNFHGIGGKLVLRSAVGDLRFDESLRSSEDTLFVYQLLSRGNDAVILWEKWYDYWHHEQNSTLNFTVEAYKDIFFCMQYICRQEWEAGRSDEAMFWVQVCSARLRRLYVRSRQKLERREIAYLKEEARRLSDSPLFKRLSDEEKWKHRLAFGCYALYKPVHRISTLRWKLQERRRNRGDWNA